MSFSPITEAKLQKEAVFLYTAWDISVSLYTMDDWHSIPDNGKGFSFRRQVQTG
jgi:hypothetical protein